jgi:quinohemoprotein ethanol dehydrogenase
MALLWGFLMSTIRSTMITAAIGITFVMLLAGCQGKTVAVAPTPVVKPIPAAAVDAVRLARASEEPDQWLTSGRDATGSYYSPLADINESNVSRLGFAWERKLGTYRGLEATPVVADGVLYVSGVFGRVYAMDAATGKELWTYNPEVDGQYGRYACCDAVNRGVALWRGRVYVGALDGYLHAIDATTGNRIWKVDTLPARGPKAPYTLTAAPVVAGNVVIVGSAGADFAGVRGYIAAYDLDTGAFRWRFYTVPRDPKLGPQDQPHLVEAVKTWDPHHHWDHGIGGAVWNAISFDPKLNLIYIGTGNGAPYNIRESGNKGGDDLYTAAIVAVHADSGKLAWYYQTTPGDRWDYDSTQNLILTDLDLGDGPRAVLMQASKNGYYYVLDRATGKFLSARNFANVTWAKGIDPTGRPIVSAEAEYTSGAKLISPSLAGAHSWQPMSYDPQTRLTYIPTVEWSMVLIDAQKTRAGLVESSFTVQAVPVEDYDPASLKSLYGPQPPLAKLTAGGSPAKTEGYLRAWDPVHQKLAWQVKTASNWDGGVLSSGGNLVFQGDSAGNLSVYRASDGVKLKTVEIGTGVMAAPSTYRVNGVQYVVVLAGFGGNMAFYPLRKDFAAWKYSNEGRIVAFKLDGGAVPLPPQVELAPFPKPPAHEGPAAKIANGEVLYNRYCSRCHQLGRGVLPDLRRLTPEKHALFYDIVLGGLLKGAGMARWDDVLSRQDAESIHAYIVDESWKAYEAETHATGH